MPSEKKSKITRYMGGYVNYKSVTCKVTEYEDVSISSFCRKNNISKSLFMTAAAMYCVKNNIDIDRLLENSASKLDYDLHKEELADDIF